MKIFALVRAELRRLTSTKMAVLAFVALMTVPLLYGGLYLWGNQDPYQRLSGIPVALVVADTGAVDARSGEQVDYGTQVAKQLVDDGSFDWHRVSAQTAAAGVDDGRYDFAVTLPADFSTALISGGTSDPTQAQVTLTTDDTNGYLSTTIATQALETVRSSIAQQVGEKASKQLIVALGDVRGDLVKATDAAGELADGAGSARSGADRLAAGTTSLADGSTQLADGAAKLATGTRAVSDGAASLASGTATLSTGAAGLADGSTTLATGAQSAASGATALAQGLATLDSRTSGLPAQAQALADGAATVAAGNAQLVTQATAASGELSGLTALLRQAGVPQSQIDAQTADLTAKLADLTALATGAQQVADGAAALAQAAPALSSGITQAHQGATGLATGTAQLADGAARLRDGAGSLAAGAASAASGAQSLAAGAASAASGATSLASGAAQLSSGATTAAQGAATLDDGLGTLADGTAQLHGSLADGTAQLPNDSASTQSKQANTISDPVAVTDHKVTDAGTYGAGLAPFFIALAAWIGIYALFLIVRPASKRAITAMRSPVRVALAGWAAPATLGVIQMLALFAIVRWGLGFGIAAPWSMIALMALASVSYTAILVALNVWLGSVGQFLGLVLMVLQLVVAGGTFPWQTLPGPLQALHHVLPMGHVVDALRQAMYGGDVGAAWADAGYVAIWLAGGLLLAVVGVVRQTRSRTLRDLRPSLIG